MAFDDSIFAGSTSKIIEVMIRSSTTGQGLTGLAFGSVTASYVREGSTRTAITLASGVAGAAYSSGKWAEVDATNTPGLYQLHVPDAAIAASAASVTIFLKASGASDKAVRIKLRAVNVQDAVRMGLTALPNAAAGASGGVYVIGGTGVTVATNNDKTGYTASTVSDKTGYSLSSTQTFNVTGNITGNLSGSVGSVTGAVGSVTGNVGGNVVGSTASVTGAVGSVTGNVGGNVTGSVGSISGVTFPTGFSTLTVAAIQSGLATSANQTTIITHLTDIKGTGWVTGDNLHSRLDAAVSSRLSSGAYTAPNNTGIDSLITYAGEVQTKLFGISSLAGWLGLIAGKTADTDVLAEINNTTGGASYNNTTDSLEAQKDAGVTVVNYLATGTVASTTGTTTTLDAGAVATAGYYVGSSLVITAGPGVGQERVITAYTIGRAATHDAWTTNPTSSSTYEVRTARSSATVTAGDAPTAEENAAAVVAALAGSDLTINAPVDTTNGDRLNLVAGDDYTEGNRIPTWTVTNYVGPTLGTTGVVRLLRIADYNRKGSDADAVLEVVATVATAGSTVTITAPIGFADTEDLANIRPGEDDSHKYQIVVDTAAGKPNTLKIGPVTVTRRIEPQE